MSDDKLYEQQKKQVLQYEAVGNANLQENQTELAYRNLNSGFFNLEKSQLEGDALSKWKENHEEKKKSIEAAWHQKTEADVKSLRSRAAASNKKSRAYYRGYNLEELEIFLKNSDRGGNSEEYNNVATELELYNRIMEKGNSLEGLAVLMRLKDRTDKYISSRKSPMTTNGKIRKAIISVISEKVSEKLVQEKDEYKTKADALLAEIQQEGVSDEKVNEAFRAHYNLIYQVLNGNIELSPEEIERLDTNMETVLNKVMEQKVDESQANNISTKFFNALGWSSNEARLVEDDKLADNGSEMKKAVLKKRLYHAINPYGDNKDAKEAGKQLAGVKKENNRLFYGLGRFGKGVYTSAGKDDSEENDHKAEMNSWGYGKDVGAVQLVMVLNEHARMLSYTEFTFKLEEKFDNMFKKVSAAVRKEQTSKFAYRDYLTMKAAFFGYNTLIDHHPNIDGVIYLVTTDRKALTISKDMRLRYNAREEDFYYPEHLKKENEENEEK